MRKLLKSKIVNQQQFQEKVIQHLQHDFVVEQSLSESDQHANNSQAYIALLNSVSFQNRNKKRKIIQFNRQLMTSFSPVRHSLNEQPSLDCLFTSSEDIKTIQKKIVEQQEIENHLQSEMEEILKSINLLKGDVSRLISKNQSTKIQERKVGKVQIVAFDQLKKVSSALSKDHAEIQERNNMQIKFNKKLKDISSSENGVLQRVKTNYCRMEKRKKIIYSKIGKMEELINNLDNHERIAEETNLLNNKNRMSLQEITSLMTLINSLNLQNKVSMQQQMTYQNDLEHNDEISMKILSLQSQQFAQKVKEMEDCIVTSIKQLKISIQSSDARYRNIGQLIEQKKQKLKQINEQFQNIQEVLFSNAKSCYSINTQSKDKYSKKLYQFSKKLNVLYVIWGFVQNHVVFTSRINDINENQQTKSRKQQNAMISRFYRKSQEFKKNTMLTQQQNNYITRLHDLLQYLQKESYDQDMSQEYIFKQLEMNIILWLKGLKNIILEGSKIKEHFRIQKPKSMGIDMIRSSNQIDSQVIAQNVTKKYRISQTEEEQDKFKIMLECIAPKRSMFINVSLMQSGIQETNRFRRTEGDDDSCKAQRVKLLQKIDYNYYKMLKNVLQIEKENIKKNYDFNRTFNRAKYTQKNIIQQEKRYESTFALQFIKKSQNKKIEDTQRSTSRRESQSDQFLPKRKQNHHQTQYFQNFRGMSLEDSSPNIKSSKITKFRPQKSSFFKVIPNMPKTHKNSSILYQPQPGFKAKTIRASVLNLKRSVINFLQPNSLKQTD